MKKNVFFLSEKRRTCLSLLFFLFKYQYQEINKYIHNFLRVQTFHVIWDNIQKKNMFNLIIYFCGVEFSLALATHSQRCAVFVYSRIYIMYAHWKIKCACCFVQYYKNQFYENTKSMLQRRWRSTQDAAISSPANIFKYVFFTIQSTLCRSQFFFFLVPYYKCIYVLYVHAY